MQPARREGELAQRKWDSAPTFTEVPSAVRHTETGGEEGQRSGGDLRGHQVNSQGVEVIPVERDSEEVRALV